MVIDRPHKSVPCVFSGWDPLVELRVDLIEDEGDAESLVPQDVGEVKGEDTSEGSKPADERNLVNEEEEMLEKQDIAELIVLGH